MAHAEKLLAEWFWIDRWDGSSASLLPLEARGLYREMLSQAWRRGGRLPANHDAIQRAVRCSADEWARCWPQIKRFWRVDGDDLVNDTQLEVYAETVATRERRSRAGSKGGANTQAKRQADTQAKLKPPSPSPSPLSSLVVGREVVVASRTEPPARLPTDRAEVETQGEIRRLQNELGARLARLAEHPNSRDMVPAWSRRVTAYKRRDGTRINGVPDYRTVMSIDRLERSIEDAEQWLAALDKGPVAEAQRG